MIHRLPLVAGLLLAAAGSVLAEDAPKPAVAPGADGNRFIRFLEDDQHGQLQTAVTCYENAQGIAVDLVGAVHLADPAYYAGLNKTFSTYDVVLFEMVGGDQQPADGDKQPAAGDGGGLPARAQDPAAVLLRSVQLMVTNLLKLQHQFEGIDYKARNFVHADVSWDQFRKLQAERNETFLTLLQRAVKSQRDEAKQAEGKQPAAGEDDLQSILALVAALQDGDPSGLKLMMARQFEGAERTIGAFEGEKGSVIIAERNKVVIEKLEEQMKAGRKKVAVFYGAGHYPDLEKRLIGMGFRQTRHEWRTAWDIPKPGKAARPEAPERKEAA